MSCHSDVTVAMIIVLHISGLANFCRQRFKPCFHLTVRPCRKRLQPVSAKLFLSKFLRIYTKHGNIITHFFIKYSTVNDHFVKYLGDINTRIYSIVKVVFTARRYASVRPLAAAVSAAAAAVLAAAAAESVGSCW